MGTLGVQEMVVIFLVALVLFGPKKLPELGRTIGKALTEFRRASNDLKATFEREMQTLERENESLKQITQNAAMELQSAAAQVYDPASYLPYNEDAHLLPRQNDEFHSHETPLHDTSASSDSTATNHPTNVGASEVPGAESNGTTSTETHSPADLVTASVASERPPVEGTVARNEVPEIPRSEMPEILQGAAHPEKPQHSQG